MRDPLIDEAYEITICKPARRAFWDIVEDIEKLKERADFDDAELRCLTEEQKEFLKRLREVLDGVSFNGE